LNSFLSSSSSSYFPSSFGCCSLCSTPVGRRPPPPMPSIPTSPPKLAAHVFDTVFWRNAPRRPKVLCFPGLNAVQGSTLLPPCVVLVFPKRRGCLVPLLTRHRFPVRFSQTFLRLPFPLQPDCFPFFPIVQLHYARACFFLPLFQRSYEPCLALGPMGRCRPCLSPWKIPFFFPHVTIHSHDRF